MKVKCPMCGNEIEVSNKEILQQAGKMLGERNRGRKSPTSRENVKKAFAASMAKVTPEQRREFLAKARAAKAEQQKLVKEFQESAEYREFLAKKNQGESGENKGE